MPAIHQFVAGFSNGDAISNEARVLRGIFRSWGYTAEIFSEPQRILPELRSEAHDALACRETLRADDVVLLHLSIGSAVNETFAALPCRKVILYHNVTPPEYFEFINKEIAHNLALGRRQVRSLAASADLTLADSRFNAEELRDMGYRDVEVLPLVLDLERLRDAPDRRILKRFRDGRVNVLFVGRCVPNKRIEDALRVFSIFVRTVEPHARFIHVGSYNGTERYYYFLLSHARELGLEHVVFTGSVPQHALNAYYRCADLFLCMSEHEGFCIPLIESMVHGVPVLAVAAAAVPETMERSGVLFADRNPGPIAETMGRVVRDSDLRRALVLRQNQRLAAYAERDLEAELKRHMTPVRPDLR